VASAFEDVLTETLSSSDGAIPRLNELLNEMLASVPRHTSQKDGSESYNHDNQEPCRAETSEAAGQRAAAQRRVALQRTADELRGLGAAVYLPAANQGLDWSSMAGYEEQKSTVEDLVLMSMTHAAEYDAMAKKTRKDGKCQRPKVCCASLVRRAVWAAV
jgi:hypothetical protein